MILKKGLQWAILGAFLLATVLNILCLAGMLPRSAATVGVGAVICLWAIQLVLKRRWAALPAEPDTPAERTRGILTAVFAGLWVLTAALSYFIQ